MTRFSVVVPMWSAEAFADECPWSVRRQACVDLEVVAVDDDSPDGCGAIIDRHAREEDRVTALHLNAATESVLPATTESPVRAASTCCSSTPTWRPPATPMFRCSATRSGGPAA